MWIIILIIVWRKELGLLIEIVNWGIIPKRFKKINVVMFYKDLLLLIIIYTIAYPLAGSVRYFSHVPKKQVNFTLQNSFPKILTNLQNFAN